MGRNKELANPKGGKNDLVSSSSMISSSSRVFSSVMLSSAGVITKGSSCQVSSSSSWAQVFFSSPAASGWLSRVTGGRQVSSIESRVPEKLRLWWPKSPELRATASRLETGLGGEAFPLPSGRGESKSFFWLVFSSSFLIVLEPFRGVCLL